MPPPTADATLLQPLSLHAVPPAFDGGIADGPPHVETPRWTPRNGEEGGLEHLAAGPALEINIDLRAHAPPGPRVDTGAAARSDGPWNISPGQGPTQEPAAEAQPNTEAATAGFLTTAEFPDARRTAADDSATDAPDSPPAARSAGSAPATERPAAAPPAQRAAAAIPSPSPAAERPPAVQVPGESERPPPTETAERPAAGKNTADGWEGGGETAAQEPVSLQGSPVAERSADDLPPGMQAGSTEAASDIEGGAGGDPWQELLSLLVGNAGGAAAPGTEPTVDSAGTAAQRTPPLRTQLEQVFSAAVRHGRGLRIELSPPELGPMQIDVGRAHGRLTAVVEVAAAATQRLVQEGIASLAESLSGLGFEVERIEVRWNAELGANLGRPRDDARTLAERPPPGSSAQPDPRSAGSEPEGQGQRQYDRSEQERRAAEQEHAARRRDVRKPMLVRPAYGHGRLDVQV